MSDPEDEPAGVKLPEADGRVAVRLGVNGRPRTLRVRTTQTLLDALREQPKLFGARSGCGVGMCGACTVLDGDRAISGCLTLAVLCDGADIRTVEGLQGPDGQLSAVQEAFLRHRAFQCSYCTSGFILALESVLAREAAPTEEAIREAFTGHLCRCGSYSRIMAASLEVAGLEPAPAVPGEEA
jgi:aerobic-type carbon monoxide dehydrogenase small subunit (CoxS/CutS family)